MYQNVPQMFQNEQELRQACGEGPFHTALSMYIGRDFI